MPKRMKINLSKCINHYKSENPHNAWSYLWEYVSSFSANPYDMFNSDNLLRTVYNTHIYMVNFGMGRGVLRTMTGDDFQKLVVEYADEMNQHNLFGLRLSNSQDVLDAANSIDSFVDAILELNLYKTEVFFSKVIMGLWGHSVAWDRHFCNALYYLHGDEKSKSEFDRMNWSTLYDFLLSKYKNEIGKLSNDLTHTSNNVPIPPLRLIDMAYWQFGYTLVKT